MLTVATPAGPRTKLTYNPDREDLLAKAVKQLWPVCSLFSALPSFISSFMSYAAMALMSTAPNISLLITICVLPMIQLLLGEDELGVVVWFAQSAATTRTSDI